MEAAVNKIDFSSKSVYATLKDGKKVSVSYDKLILATGSIPIIPPFPGKDLKNVQTVKLFQDAQKLIDALDKGIAKNVGIIGIFTIFLKKLYFFFVGAGYIGVELAEAIVRRNAKAHLFDVSKTSLSTYYDDWFTLDMDKNLGFGFSLNYCCIRI
jgi:NAD(P)H-nitrite reductase large subunit